MEFLENIVAFFNDILWSYVLVVMLIALGLWFSLKTKFVQIRMFREMIRLLLSGSEEGRGQVGLRNVHRRLKLIYGGDGKLTVEETDHGTILARIWFPVMEREGVVT